MSAQEVERDKIREQLLAKIGRADDLEALEDARVASLGRNGIITSLMKSVGQLEPQERKEAGRIYNSLKQEIIGALLQKLAYSYLHFIHIIHTTFMHLNGLHLV